MSRAACGRLDTGLCSYPLPQEGTRLRRRAFHDAPFLTTSLKVIKSFILNADVHRGPQFLRFKVRPKHLHPIVARGRQRGMGGGQPCKVAAQFQHRVTGHERSRCPSWRAAQSMGCTCTHRVSAHQKRRLA